MLTILGWKMHCSKNLCYVHHVSVNFSVAVHDILILLNCMSNTATTAPLQCQYVGCGTM